MKRSARELEQQLVAYDVVRVAPEAELGPLVMYTFFSTTEALLDALHERPLLILRLMQTNKAMYKLWDQVPRLWPVMLDAVVARVYGGEWVAPYALLLITARRALAFKHEFLRLVDWDDIADEGGYRQIVDYWKQRLVDESQDSLMRVVARMRWQLYHKQQYAVWDTVVPVFAACYQYAKYMESILPTGIAFHVKEITVLLEWWHVEADIIFVDADLTSGQLLRQITEWTAGVVDRTARISHGPLLGSAAEVIVMGLPGTDEFAVAHRAFYPLGVARALDLLTRKIGQLRYCLDRVHETLPAPDTPGYDNAVAAALPLTPIAQAHQYRELLWRDIITEPAQQRALVVGLARTSVAGNPEIESDLSALHCATCARPTAHVDTQQMMAFCEDAHCAQLYAQCVT